MPRAAHRSEKQSPEITAKRVGGRRPGAGRPKGRKNDRTLEIEAAAKLHAPAALQALVAIAKKGKSEGSRVAAAVALLDRGYGRPRQSLEHSGPDGGPIPVQADELRGRLAGRIAGLAGRMVPVIATNGTGTAKANGNGHG